MEFSLSTNGIFTLHEWDFHSPQMEFSFTAKKQSFLPKSCIKHRIIIQKYR